MRFFFFNDTATTEIYTLSLHDALPISTDEVRRDARIDGGDPRPRRRGVPGRADAPHRPGLRRPPARPRLHGRSEEHTSELQSRQYLVCRLLLEKKKN